MTVVFSVTPGPWEALYHDLGLRLDMVVSSGSRWLCSIGRVEQLAAGEFGVIGSVRAVAAEAFGADCDDALYGALCVWIDKGVRGDG